MLLFCLQPIIDFFVAYSNLHAKRWYKRSYVYRDENEIKRDTLTYIDMHAGPEYPFYYQTSKTITVMLICLIFGSSMPILFLVGILALIIQYATDRISLAYFYRLPPMHTHDSTL